MLYRKIERNIIDHLRSKSNKILMLDGARQIGKSYIIRHAAQQIFKNYVEINLVEDKQGAGFFANCNTTDKFYFQLSMLAGERLSTKDDTIIFLDEIQEYPHIITLLKFLREDNRYTFITSGSLLGVTLSAEVVSLPIGSVEILHMYQLDFEEFLIANGFGELALEHLRTSFLQEESLDETVHARVLELFKLYLLIGGLPDAVQTYLDTKNIVSVRSLHNSIHQMYVADAAKYDKEHKLKIRMIYNLMPSNLESKKKRIIYKDIENKKGARYETYKDEFDYLISSGIALEVKAVSNPTYPLIQSATKNLLKLYINDVGLFTNLLYGKNIRAVLNDDESVNLGAVYESVVASELKAHGFSLYYYDNKKNGEVDYLIDDQDNLAVLPIEVKSGKDYTTHSALDKLIANKDYRVDKGYVLSNQREISKKGEIIYLPIYYVMFLKPNLTNDIYLP